MARPRPRTPSQAGALPRIRARAWPRAPAVILAAAAAPAAGAAPALSAPALAEALAACSARHADAAAASPPDLQPRLRQAARSQRELALRLGGRTAVQQALDTAQQALAERRARPDGAAELDAGFAAAREACNQLIERHMGLIDSLREGR